MLIKSKQKIKKINLNPHNKITIKEFFQNKDYDYVSIRMATSDGDDYPVGIACCKKGKLIPLDGDTYGENALVLSYEEWSNVDKEIDRGLTIWCDEYI